MKTSNQIDNDGATAVITHNVLERQQDNYEKWLMKIVPLGRTYPGHLDWQVVRPIAGLTSTYTVIIRFDTHEHLLGWLHSIDRKRLIEEARPFLATEDSFYTRSGLDFLFVPDGEKKAHFPTKWKQFLVTWIGVYPLSLLSQMLFAPALHQAGFSDNIYLKTFILSGILVYLMVYVVMPKFTKLLQRWLYQ